MKLKSFLFLLFFLPAMLHAENISGIVITHTDGSHQEFTLAAIRSIRFSGNLLVVNAKDGNQYQHDVNQIVQIAFADVTSFLRALAAEGSTEPLTITDLSGHVCYKGCPKSEALPEDLHGTFIFTTTAGSRKVKIGK